MPSSWACLRPYKALFNLQIDEEKVYFWNLEGDLGKHSHAKIH